MTDFIQQLKNPQTKQADNVKVSIPVPNMQVKRNCFYALQRNSTRYTLKVLCFNPTKCSFTICNKPNLKMSNTI